MFSCWFLEWDYAACRVKLYRCRSGILLLASGSLKAKWLPNFVTSLEGIIRPKQVKMDEDISVSCSCLFYLFCDGPKKFTQKAYHFRFHKQLQMYIWIIQWFNTGSVLKLLSCYFNMICSWLPKNLHAEKVKNNVGHVCARS